MSTTFPAFKEVFNRFFSTAPPDVLGLDPVDMLGAMIHIVEGELLKPEVKKAHKEEEEALLRVDEEVTPEDLKDLLGMEESDDDDGGAEITVQLKGIAASSTLRPLRTITARLRPP